MPAPAIGQPAPDFTLDDDHGKSVTLSSLRGKKVLLYFYPKDDTPGCTREGCAFRDAKPDYDAAGVLVFGISTDDVASHQVFRDKFQFNFPLLADTGHKVCEAYGVWKNPGIFRHSFLIDERGTLVRHYDKVDPSVHAAQILADLKG